MPISAECIQELDVIQNKLGKTLLGVPSSTRNPVVAVELGLKPFHLRVSQAKLSYFRRVSDPGFRGSPLVATCNLHVLEYFVRPDIIHEEPARYAFIVLHQ